MKKIVFSIAYPINGKTSLDITVGIAFWYFYRNNYREAYV